MSFTNEYKVSIDTGLDKQINKTSKNLSLTKDELVTRAIYLFIKAAEGEKLLFKNNNRFEVLYK